MQVIIEHQLALLSLLNLLTHNYKKSIKREACWTISNITARNRNHIQIQVHLPVFQPRGKKRALNVLEDIIEAGIIAPLVQQLQNAEFEIKKEASCAISNATFGGTHDQIKFLVSQGCIKQLCDLLVCPDPRIVTVCLEALENILKVG